MPVEIIPTRLTLWIQVINNKPTGVLQLIKTSNSIQFSTKCLISIVTCNE